MKHIEKKELTTKQLTSVILAGVLEVLLAVCILVGIILTNQETGTTKQDPPEILEGEAIENGLAVAYPSITEKSEIDFIEIKNPTNKFGFIKMDDEDFLTMYYYDSDGERQVYYPKILAEDATVDYTDFFSIETSDGFSRYSKLDYLCLALQSPYFAHRIELSEDAATREQQLKEYGFAEGEYTTVSFSYTRTDSTTAESITLKIGSKGIAGTGYYFIVGDRPYVYSSSNNYYDYAVAEFTVFIKALVVADGLEEDKGFGPFLTTGYYQWKNEVHDGIGETVTEDSKVIVYTDIFQTEISDDPLFSGYYKESDLVEIDLSKYKSNSQYRRMISALVGAKNGDGNIVFTISSSSNNIDFGSESVKTYQYTVTAIESIISDSGEITAEGAVCGNENNLIKISYTSTVDGKATSSHVRHAVLDLTSAAIPDDAEAYLRAAAVGTLPSPYVFSVGYTKENSVAVNGKYTIIEIISIYDSEYNRIDKVTENSIVGYRYRVEKDGEIVSEATDVLDLSKVSDEMDIEIKNALIDKGVSQNLSIEFDETTVYYECFENFTTYSISKIEYFITSELITAFKFQNSSQRDPYYGESFYENLSDEHKLYGLNASTCEYVVSLLGGLSEESTSATAAGLAGDEVVAMGLTPEVMKKYGLYAHSIYFELPRSIYAYTPDSSDTTDLSEALDDYGYYDTLGFNIYLSEVDPVTNTRYIASDMYDIVTRVDADQFNFLNYSFEEAWARKNIILMDSNNMESVKIDFNMSDIKGSYLFDLIHEEISYRPSQNAEPEKYNKITVSVTSSDLTRQNKLNDFIKANNYDGHVSLSELYTAVYGTEDPELREIYPDSLGTAYFKEAILMLYLMAYVDVMPEDERAEALSPENMLMRMSFETNFSAREYVYEFYRADDRRILVKMYTQDMGGNVSSTVSDFYVSTFTFKKIVSNFTGILNAEKIDPNIAYYE